MGKPEKSPSNSKPASRQQQVLTHWRVVAAQFYDLYRQVHQQWQVFQISQISPQLNTWIGQCPASQMRDLLISMQMQLEKLLLDLENLDPSPPEGHYTQLSRHTRLLESLNQQAEVLLQLTTLPAC